MEAEDTQARERATDPRQPPPFKHATCRGSYALGSACGHCERCAWERQSITVANPALYESPQPPEPVGSPAWVREVCSYHSPDPVAKAKIENIRQAEESMLNTIFRNVPNCADRTAAVRKIREACFTANSAIVLGGLV